MLNQAEITFHELHTAKLTTFDFFKTLTDMHEMLHDDHCASTEFAFNKYHLMSGDDDDPWVGEIFLESATLVSLASGCVGKLVG